MLCRDLIFLVCFVAIIKIKLFIFIWAVKTFSRKKTFFFFFHKTRNPPRCSTEFFNRQGGHFVNSQSLTAIISEEAGKNDDTITQLLKN